MGDGRMSSQQPPYPMPQSMRDEVNMKLGDRQMAALDSNGRFIVRRMVAEAYARGFFDGGLDALRADQVDREVEQDKRSKASEMTYGGIQP